MKKILLTLLIALSASMVNASIDYNKANKEELIGYIDILEDQLSQALTSLDNLIVREKTIIDGINTQITTVFDKSVQSKLESVNKSDRSKIQEAITQKRKALADKQEIDNNKE